MRYNIQVPIEDVEARILLDGVKRTATATRRALEVKLQELVAAAIVAEAKESAKETVKTTKKKTAKKDAAD